MVLFLFVYIFCVKLNIEKEEFPSN